MGAKQTPLIDLLVAIPADARLIINDSDGMGSRYIPVGRLCQEAAEALRARLAQPEPEPVAWKVGGTWQEVKEPVLQWICVGGGGQGESNINKPVATPVGCIEEVHTNHPWGGSVGVEPKLYGRLPVGTLLYTAPPSKQWQGLTDEEIDKTCETQVWDARRSYARAIEAKLKEKNA